MKLFLLCLLGIQVALAAQHRNWEPNSYRGQESHKEDFAGAYQGEGEYHAPAVGREPPAQEHAGHAQAGSFAEAPNVPAPHQQAPFPGGFPPHPQAPYQPGGFPQGIPRGFPGPQGFMGPPRGMPCFPRGFPGPLPPGFPGNPYARGPQPNFPPQQQGGSNAEAYAPGQQQRFPRAPFQPPFPPRMFGQPGFPPNIPGGFPGQPPFLVPPMMMQPPQQFPMRHVERQSKDIPRDDRSRTQSEASSSAASFQEAPARDQRPRYPPQGHYPSQ